MRQSAVAAGFAQFAVELAPSERRVKEPGLGQGQAGVVNRLYIDGDSV
jgi:hypothetical protein